jgi:hypothetical protein
VHRALGELAHLTGDDGKSPAGVAGPRRLDRRVEREQVGLLGDSVDQLEYLTDLLAALACLKRLSRCDLGALGDRRRARAELLQRGRDLGDRRRLLARGGSRLERGRALAELLGWSA